MMFVTLQGFSLEIIALLGVAVILVGLGLIVPDHLHVSFEEFGGGEAREVGYDHVLFDPWVLHNLAEVGLIGNLGQEVVVVFKYFSDHWEFSGELVGAPDCKSESKQLFQIISGWYLGFHPDYN